MAPDEVGFHLHRPRTASELLGAAPQAGVPAVVKPAPPLEKDLGEEPPSYIMIYERDRGTKGKLLENESI